MILSYRWLAVYGNDISIQPVNGSRRRSITLTAVRCSALCLAISYVFILQMLAVYGNNLSIQPVNGGSGGYSFSKLSGVQFCVYLTIMFSSYRCWQYMVIIQASSQ